MSFAFSTFAEDCCLCSAPSSFSNGNGISPCLIDDNTSATAADGAGTGPMLPSLCAVDSAPGATQSPAGAEERTMGAATLPDAAQSPAGAEERTMGAGTLPDAAQSPAGAEERTMGAGTLPDAAQSPAGAEERTMGAGTLPDAAQSPAGVEGQTMGASAPPYAAQPAPPLRPPPLQPPAPLPAPPPPPAGAEERTMGAATIPDAAHSPAGAEGQTMDAAAPWNVPPPSSEELIHRLKRSRLRMQIEFDNWSAMYNYTFRMDFMRTRNNELPEEDEYIQMEAHIKEEIAKRRRALPVQSIEASIRNLDNVSRTVRAAYDEAQTHLNAASQVTAAYSAAHQPRAI